MSGPIVRKYGFPNFEKIFGEREIEHGVDEPEEGETTEAPTSPAKKPKAAAKPKSKAKSKAGEN